MTIEAGKFAEAPICRRNKVSTKERILNHAERALAAHGYQGTSLRQIAATSKVNQTLINYYFGSKEAVFVSTARRLLAGRQPAANQRSLDLSVMSSRKALSQLYTSI